MLTRLYIKVLDINPEVSDINVFHVCFEIVSMFQNRRCPSVYVKGSSMSCFKEGVFTWTFGAKLHYKVKRGWESVVLCITGGSTPGNYDAIFGEKKSRVLFTKVGCLMCYPSEFISHEVEFSQIAKNVVHIVSFRDLIYNILFIIFNSLSQTLKL